MVTSFGVDVTLLIVLLARELELELILSRMRWERGGSGRRVARRKARVKRGLLGAEK